LYLQVRAAATISLSYAGVTDCVTVTSSTVPRSLISTSIVHLRCSARTSSSSASGTFGCGWNTAVGATTPGSAADGTTAAGCDEGAGAAAAVSTSDVRRRSACASSRNPSTSNRTSASVSSQAPICSAAASSSLTRCRRGSASGAPSTASARALRYSSLISCGSTRRRTSAIIVAMRGDASGN